MVDRRRLERRHSGLRVRTSATRGSRSKEWWCRVGSGNSPGANCRANPRLRGCGPWTGRTTPRAGWSSFYFEPSVRSESGALPTKLRHHGAGYPNRTDALRVTSAALCHSSSSGIYVRPPSRYVCGHYGVCAYASRCVPSGPAVRSAASGLPTIELWGLRETPCIPRSRRNLGPGENFEISTRALQKRRSASELSRQIDWCPQHDLNVRPHPYHGCAAAN